MPVENHEVHPSTQHNNHRYTACQQKVRKPGYWVMTREYIYTGIYALRPEWIEDTSSTGCRNVSFETDPACRGCEFPKDFAYIEKMRNL